MRSLFLVAVFLLIARVASARDWHAEARRTAVGFIPTVAQTVPAGAIFHASYCVVVEAIVANTRGRELTPWGMLECVPVVGSGLARAYRNHMPLVCSYGPDAFPYRHSRQSFYIIDRPRESYSRAAYQALCRRAWRGAVSRQVEDDF